MSDLETRVQASRAETLVLSAPLSDEDQCVQAMPDASPTKWHLAHTTWFYETFVLRRFLPDYKVFDDRYHYCFNSYYEAEGPRHPRSARGLLTRPSNADVRCYRGHVDNALAQLFARGIAADRPEVASLIELGVNHEQQHQELLLTDILALFDLSPLRPAYAQRNDVTGRFAASSVTWCEYEGGLSEIGYSGSDFHFDCEAPRHSVVVEPFRFANRLVTNGEWLEFIGDRGYTRPELWLSDGWAVVKSNHWQAPGYWTQLDGSWHQMTLSGLVRVDPSLPVSHVSYYEADAFAGWANKRLPTEQEWEHATSGLPTEGNTLGTGRLMPAACAVTSGGGLQQVFGDVWEWTRSSFSPYPRYRTAAGAVGEYNGKFMSGQFVLRGASCVTPDGHSRASYRNFFYPHQRWQFTGVRLAEDI